MNPYENGTSSPMNGTSSLMNGTSSPMNGTGHCEFIHTNNTILKCIERFLARSYNYIMR